MSNIPETSPSSSMETKPYSDGLFRWNPKQKEALRLLASPATHVMLRGGSRSGKTFLLTTTCIIRALKAPESTHTILRFRFNHLLASIINDTFPRAMKLRFPGVSWKLNQRDWDVEFGNGSRILFGGLDTGDRVEKILGQEHSTIYLNECSQLSYDARNKAVTRLAQKSGLALKCFYDCNPPTVGHWTYRLFEQKLEPKSGEALANPASYASMMLNPDDNRGNLAPEYIAQLEALPEKDRRRFLHGEYLAQVDNALWTLDRISQNRMQRAQVPELQRIVVAVDPSGCRGPEDGRSDEIGIVVAGIDYAGHGYVLQDLSGRYTPQGWAKAVLHAYDDFQADRIVAEKNFGGALVESNILSARKTAPITMVTATRGKVVRAEPIAALYERNMVTHIGSFPDMEDQMCQFSTAGYQGSKSPDRADAMVWALTDLMLDGSSYDNSMNWVG
jgi:Terminase large subunit, T4likevirus-type, N-terminal/Terminase RNaseH-like domain